MKEIDQIKLEKKQLTSEKNHDNELSTILRAKADILKSELRKSKEENSNLKEQLSQVDNKNRDLSDLLMKASAKIKKLHIEIAMDKKQTNKKTEKADGETLINNENKANENEKILKLNFQITKYENIVCEQDEKIKRLTLKGKEMKQRINELSSQTNSKNQEITSKHTKISEFNAQYQQIEAENKLLKIQNEKLLANHNETQLKNINLQNNLEKLEAEKCQLNKKLGIYTSSNINISNSNIQNKIEKSSYENEINILKNRISHYEEIEKNSIELSNENKRLQSQIEINLLDISKLNEQINNLKYVASEQERIKKEVLQFEVEIQDREIREQNLAKKYRYYKTKAKEQMEKINRFETQTNEINIELLRIKEREARKEAALRRKNRHKAEADSNLISLAREVNNEKTKNFRLEVKLHDQNRNPALD